MKRELQKSAAFTLAEVLITLGIIGVVAAMTIPTLIANTQGQRVRSQFKKTLSTLNQAGHMAQAQYDWDFAAVEPSYVSSETCIIENPETTKSMCALLNGTIKAAYHTYATLPYNNVTLTTGGRGSNGITDMLIGSHAHLYQLNDGAILSFSENIKDCTLSTGSVLNSEVLSKTSNTDSHGVYTPGLRQCIGFIDVNGTSLPNKEVTCADGTAALDPQNPCVVSNKNIGDIIPLVFHDGVVEPATNAGKYLLNTAK
ncbi:type II secretion system protein [bacterium]|nr:type II secretion system protein [bacterium]